MLFPYTLSANSFQIYFITATSKLCKNILWQVKVLAYRDPYCQVLFVSPRKRLINNIVFTARLQVCVAAHRWI